MTTVEINSGACGFTTRVEVKKAGQKSVEVNIETDCPNLKKAAAGIKTIMPLKELFCKLHETETYRTLLRGMVHPACLVPSGILKGVEAEMEMALPKTGCIRFLT